jgi:fatty acid desaturase
MPTHFLQKERVREYIDLPAIAWPTIRLALCCLFVQVTVCYFHAKGILDNFCAFPLSFVTLFCAFTPLHDAVHGSIAQYVPPRKLTMTSKDKEKNINDSHDKVHVVKCGVMSETTRFSSLSQFWSYDSQKNFLPYLILQWRNLCLRFHHKVFKLLEKLYFQSSNGLKQHFHKKRIIYIVYRNKIINQGIGWLCATILCQIYLPFQYLHLKHHRHTNDDKLDPDAWASEGPWYILPLKWLTLELFYWQYYFRRIHTRPIRDTILSILNIFALYGSIYYLCKHGYNNTIFYAWLIPGQFAKATLTYTFDYLPHRHDHRQHEAFEQKQKQKKNKTQNQHQNQDQKKLQNEGQGEEQQKRQTNESSLPEVNETKLPSTTEFSAPQSLKRNISRAESEYLATSVVSLYKNKASCLTILFLHQNYHIIHHLCPFIPFYQYETVWNQAKEELIENGTQILPILPHTQ